MFIGLSISGLTRVITAVFTDQSLFFQRISIPLEDYISSTPLIYSVMLNFCYSYFLFSVHRQEIKKTTFLIITLLVVLFHMTYLSVSGFVIFFLINIIFVSYIYLKRVYKALVILLFSISVFSFAFLLTETGGNVLSKIEGESSRVRNYSTSIQVIAKSPVIGYGVGNEINTLQSNRNQASWEFKEKYNAHNQYFEFLIGGGLINLTLYLSLFFLALIHSLKNDKILLILFLINIMFTMYVESLLVIHKGFIFVSLILPYLIFVYDNKEDLYSKNL